MRKLPFIMKKVHAYDAGWIYAVSLSEIIAMLITFMNIYAPKYIFRYLFDTPFYKAAFMVISLYGSCLLVLQLIRNKINFKITKMEESICNAYTIDMCKIKAGLLFMELENNKTMDLINELKEYDMRSFLKTIHTFLNAIAQLLTVFGIVAIMSRLNLWILLLLSGIFTANYFVVKKMEQEGYKYMTEVQPSERKEQYYLNVMGDFRYGKDVRVYDMLPFIKYKYSLVAEEMGRCYKKIFSSNLRAYIFENATSVIEKGGIYALLAYEVIRKGLKVGDFTLYFNAVNRFSDSINALLKGYLSLSKMGLYIDDLEKFMSLPRMDGPGGEEPMESGERFDLELEDVSFRYPGAAGYALRHVNLRIAAGERLAIVGANGAGKTTLVKLLLRLYVPTEGRILLNGRDIRGFRYDEYIREFSAVFQDYKLFAFSLAENVCLSREYSEGEAMEAIRKSGLSGRVSELPLKEKTPLFKAYNEGGVELSGGEGQKLAIARALHKKSRVVVLDEPTAALDPAAEHEIYSRFDELVQGKTSIYITHRLASTRFSEKIIVLDGGRIVEEGDHASLLGRGGLYAQMYNMQAEYYASGEGGNVK